MIISVKCMNQWTPQSTVLRSCICLFLSSYLSCNLAAQGRLAKMGSYVSVGRCMSDYGVNMTSICNGTVTRGTVPPNPDVAGIGVRFFSRKDGHMTIH